MTIGSTEGVVAVAAPVPVVVRPPLSRSSHRHAPHLDAPASLQSKNRPNQSQLFSKDHSDYSPLTKLTCCRERTQLVRQVGGGRCAVMVIQYVRQGIPSPHPPRIVKLGVVVQRHGCAPSPAAVVHHHLRRPRRCPVGRCRSRGCRRCFTGLCCRLHFQKL